MTLEVTLLLSMFALILGGAFFGENGPMKVFQSSGPRLGARIERHLDTGRDFNSGPGTKNRWAAPPTQAPTGKLTP